MGLVEIRTARLLLRPIIFGDADSVHQYRGDPAVAAFLTHPPFDIEENREFVARAAALWSTVDDERFNLLFAVVLHGVVIGDVHAWNVAESPQPASPDPADVWIGCALRPDQQGHGYATEAVRALVDWLFARGARNVFANYYLDNTSSRRLLASASRSTCVTPRNRTHAASTPPLAGCGSVRRPKPPAASLSRYGPRRRRILGR
jgi:RimJ/RimL family protein N-acetyltransferase